MFDDVIAVIGDTLPAYLTKTKLLSISASSTVSSVQRHDDYCSLRRSLFFGTRLGMIPVRYP